MSPQRCRTGKVPHHSLHKARLHLRRLLQQSSNRGLEVMIYRCRCGAWHVGHQPWHAQSAERRLRLKAWWTKQEKWR